MAYRNLMKLSRFPTVWCGGCGIGLAFRETTKVFEKLGMNNKNTTVVSGIGCSARAAGYFNLDSVHCLHGRAIAVAEGIKRANKKLNVVVFSGDGDLTGIGGNHLIHASRRDINLTVICIDNKIYGMTGGQLSPTTAKGIKTMTSPFGSFFQPINVQGLMRANQKHFYARSTVFHIEHLSKAIEEAIKWDGFSFVDVMSNCVQNYGRRLGFKNAYEMINSYKENYKINNEAKELKENELGIIKSER